MNLSVIDLLHKLLLSDSALRCLYTNEDVWCQAIHFDSNSVVFPSNMPWNVDRSIPLFIRQRCMDTCVFWDTWNSRLQLFKPPHRITHVEESAICPLPLHQLTDAHNWLVLQWLTGETAYAILHTQWAVLLLSEHPMLSWDSRSQSPDDGGTLFGNPWL